MAEKANGNTEIPTIKGEVQSTAQLRQALAQEEQERAQRFAEKLQKLQEAERCIVFGEPVLVPDGDGKYTIRVQTKVQALPMED